MFSAVSRCFTRTREFLNDPIVRGVGYLTGGQLVTLLLPSSKIVSATRMLANGAFFAAGSKMNSDEITFVAVALTVIGYADLAVATWVYEELPLTSLIFTITLSMSMWGGAKINLAMYNAGKSTVLTAV